MADAIPVHTKTKKESKPECEFIVPEGSPITEKELREYVAKLALQEVPEHITDKQVNEVGQKDSYGKITRAEVVLIPIHNAMGDVVKTSAHIRVWH